MAIGLATFAGLSIPLGAWLANWRIKLLPDWAETEARHGVMAFGAGALLAAVALVLIPEGMARLSSIPALFLFVLGGIGFAWIDARIKKRGGKAAQFIAMMMDYLPEALALGAVISGDLATAILVAALICLQNLPEGFNAMREMQEGGATPPGWLFLAVVPLGPLAAFVGLTLPPDFEPAIGAVMMLAAGGILYLMFEDIAPQVPLENTMIPPLGAVFGFALGLAGDMLI
ncbi:MAG: ZIP family metal transporter [Roseobacter sp.]